MSRNKKEAERRNEECIPTSEDKWSINMDKDNFIQKSERHKSRSKRINAVVSGGGKWKWLQMLHWGRSLGSWAKPIPDWEESNWHHLYGEKWHVDYQIENCRATGPMKGWCLQRKESTEIQQSRGWKKLKGLNASFSARGPLSTTQQHCLEALELNLQACKARQSSQRGAPDLWALMGESPKR